MAISFKCGGCAKAYTVKDELAGKRAQCKQCGQVMQIPAIAPSHEPDLLADSHAGGKSANAETVAGSLIQSTMDTVAGRGSSAAGRSAAGRSAAGQSAAGRSSSGVQRQPDFNEFGQAPLSPLKQVAQSEHEAFDVYGGTKQPLRQGRGPAKKNYAPGEPYSFLLLVALAGAAAYAAFSQANNYTVSPDVAAEAGKPTMAYAVSAAVTFAMTLAVVAPLVMAAWYGACKIMNIKLPPGLFLRSAGLAAVPAILVAVSTAVPALQPQAALIPLAAVPIGYALLQFIHAQIPAVAGLTAGLGTVAAALGLVISSMVSTPVQDSMLASYKQHVDQVALKVKDKKAPVVVNKTPENTGPATPVADPAVDQMVKTTQIAVDGLKTSLTNKRQTRESFEKQAAAIDTMLAAGKAKAADRAEWATLATDLQSARSQAANFPSAEPPAELTQAPPAGADWTTRPGRHEVSAFAFNLTPPLEGSLALDTKPGEKMHWQIGDSKTNMTIEQFVAASPDQQRPWVAPAFILADAKAGTFSIASDSDTAVEYGTINGLPAAKLLIPDPSNAAVATTVYAIHKGPNWVKCTIGPVATDDASMAAATQAVRSLHPRPAGEPAIDPFPATELVARYQADPKSGDTILGMLKDKPGAEDAVLKAIGFTPDESTLTRFGPLLLPVATIKSDRLLWQMAAEGTQTGDGARETLRKLEPKTADDIAFALLDVKASGTQAKKGLNTLAYADFDKTRQPAVSKTLAGGMDNGSLAMSNSGPTLEAVLGKWADEDLLKKMSTMLATESTTPENRKLAMNVLAATGKQKYVYPICKWILKDTQQVTNTLIAMGPVAETDVAKLLSEPDVIARKAALTILNEIGTQRSLSAVQTCATKSGDPEVKETAKALVLKLRDTPYKPPAATPGK